MANCWRWLAAITAFAAMSAGASMLSVADCFETTGRKKRSISSAASGSPSRNGTTSSRMASSPVTSQ